LISSQSIAYALTDDILSKVFLEVESNLVTVGNLVPFLVIVASIVTSFMSFSTNKFLDSLLSSGSFSSFRALAQQDGDNL
jgi:hypothetical protein